MHLKEKICKHNLYFHEYKFGIEVNESVQNDRNIDHEIQRQTALERELDCIFISIDPDAVDFNIGKEINKIYRHINESTRQQSTHKNKESLIDNCSKGLLELEFKQNDQIKTKFSKWIVKKV